MVGAILELSSGEEKAMCEFCGKVPFQTTVECTTLYGEQVVHRICLMCRTRLCPFGHYRN